MQRYEYDFTGGAEWQGGRGRMARGAGTIPPARGIRCYLTAWPPITGAVLPLLEFAVARTLGFSFFGFLASRLFWLLPLDMGASPERSRPGGMPGRSVLRGSGEPDRVRAMSPRAQQARRGAGAAPWKISGRERGDKRGEGAARLTGRGAAIQQGLWALYGSQIRRTSGRCAGGCQIAVPSRRRRADYQ